MARTAVGRGDNPRGYPERAVRRIQRVWPPSGRHGRAKARPYQLVLSGVGIPWALAERELELTLPGLAE